MYINILTHTYIAIYPPVCTYTYAYITVNEVANSALSINQLPFLCRWQRSYFIRSLSNESNSSQKKAIDPVEKISEGAWKFLKSLTFRLQTLRIWNLQKNTEILKVCKFRLSDEIFQFYQKFPFPQVRKKESSTSLLNSLSDVYA